MSIPPPDHPGLPGQGSAPPLPRLEDDPTCLARVRGCLARCTEVLDLPSPCSRRVDVNLCRHHLRVLTAHLETVWELLLAGSGPQAAGMARAAAHQSLVVCSLAGDPDGSWRTLGGARLDRGWGFRLMARQYLDRVRQRSRGVTSHQSRLAVVAMMALQGWLQQLADPESGAVRPDDERGVLAVALRFTVEALRSFARGCQVDETAPEVAAWREGLSDLQAGLPALAGVSSPLLPHLALLDATLPRGG